MDSEAESEARAEPHWSTALYKRFLDQMPQSRRGRLLTAILVGGVLMAMSIGLLLMPIWVDLSEERFATFGYAGVFLANLVSTGTVFIPVPGLTAIGQALIIQQGAILNPVLVGLLGGTGMALGEITAYIAGTVGSEVVEGQDIKAPKFIRGAVERVIHWIDWLIDNYGFITLVVLSAIPNPAFELAGITAGASRMNFWRFMAAVLIGKNIRGLALAFLGAAGANIPYLT
jgi:membrane protein DedA with SNARE-associated domain